MNLASRVVPVVFHKRPNDDDVIADLRHTKRIVERVAGCLRGFQCRRVCAHNLHGRERRVDTDGCRHSEDCLSEHRTLSQFAENDEYNAECD